MTGGASPVEGFVSTLEAFAAPHESVFLRWTDGTSDETGFLVERKTGDQPFAEIVTTPPDVTGYTDSGLATGTTYTYRVRALVGNDPPGREVQVTTLPGWKPPVGSPELVVSDEGEVRLEVPGKGTTYTLQSSHSLEAWTDLGEPAFVGPYERLAVTDPAPGPARFYRVLARGYERPGFIGLSMPFEAPPEPAGTVWNVTDFGASPLLATNDDAIGIKVAISIAQPGDVIYIPAGTYTIRQTLELPSGLTLRGAGMNETVLLCEQIERAVVVPPEAHDIRIEGFSINYLGDTEELLHGVYVGSVRRGNNSYRILIDGLRIEGFSVHGVSLRDCHHVLVQNCEMRNATNLGGGGHGYGIALNYPTNHNNWIRNNLIGPVIRHAILIQYEAHNNLVEHNLAVENTEDAYDLHGEDEYANELRFNIARDGLRDGFGVGNTGSTHDRSGPNNWIHHNTVENSLAGVEIIQGSDVVYIDENTFAGNQYGIRVHNYGGRHLYLRGNTIRGNQKGVSLAAAQWIWLLDNVIENQSQYGIEILGQVSDLVDEGNIFSGNTADYGPL